MSLSIQLIKKPYPLSFSGNPMLFVFALAPWTDSERTQDIIVQVTVLLENSFGTNTYEQIYSQNFYPDDAGLVSLDVKTLIDPYLEYYTARITQGYGIAVEAIDQRKRYKLSWLVLLNGALNIASQEVSGLTAIKGGLSYEEWNAASAFSGSNNALHFGNETASINQPLFFWWLSPAGGVGKLKYSFVLSAGTVPEQIINLPDLADENSVWCTPVSLYKIIAAVPALADVIIISFTVKYAVGNTVYALRTYTVDYRAFYNPFFLLYRNSLGGLSSLHLRGQVDYEAAYEREGATRIVPPSYYANKNLLPQTVQQQNQETEKFKGDTGFITKEALDTLRDLFLSPQLYEANTRLLPIVLTGNSAKFYSNKDSLYNAQIEWQHAWSNKFYTPPGYIPVNPSCPALESFSALQISRNVLQVLYAAPIPYDRVQVQINNGTNVVAYTFTSNTRSVQMTYDFFGLTEVIVTGRVLCDENSNPPSVGPASTVVLTVVPNSLPIARNDTYSINAGFNSVVSLAGSVLDNDYDPNGDAIQAVAAAGATHAGGTFTINTAGIVAYQPPSSAYQGQDYFDYNIHEVGSTTNVMARVFINVGSTVQIYAKMIVESTTTVTGGPLGGPPETKKVTTGKAYLRFFSNANATTPLDVTGKSMVANIKLWEKILPGFRHNLVATETLSTLACSSFTTLIFQGVLFLQHYKEVFTGQGSELIEYDEKQFTLMPGTGYTIL